MVVNAMFNEDSDFSRARKAINLETLKVKFSSLFEDPTRVIATEDGIDYEVELACDPYAREIGFDC